MIESVSMRHFKCFEDETIPLNRLTVLAGSNGAGKSSVIQALLLLRQSGLRKDGAPATVMWQGDLVDLGSFTDVLYEDAEEDTIVLESAFRSAGSVRVEVSRTDDGDQRLTASTGFPDAHQSSLYRCTMHYLGANRVVPPKALPTFDQIASDTPLGTKGEHVLRYLDRCGGRSVRNALRCANAANESLAAQTAAWLSVVIPGVHLILNLAPNADKTLESYVFSRKDSLGTRAFRPENIGFGLSSVLALVVALLAAEEDDLVMIENPEAHLHPVGQTKLAELAVRAAASGAQVILETHSDHVFDGIRLAVRNEIIKPEQTTVHCFQRAGLSVQAQTPVIRQDGRLDSWPDGFFDQHERNQAALIAP